MDIQYYLILLKKNRKLLLRNGIIGILIGIIIAFSIPKRYDVEIILSPESGKANNSSSLSSMASMLGFGGITSLGEDAITSSLTPDILKSTPFLIELYNIPVKTSKSETLIPLSEYIEQETTPWWSTIIKLPFKLKELFSKTDIHNENEYLNSFQLTKTQKSRIDKIKETITAIIDKKNSMTYITVSYQDPLVAAIIADSTINKLKKYVINYRTQKAKEDCIFLKKIRDEKRLEYYNAQEKYANFVDKNKNIILQSSQANQTRLENDMNLAYQIYSQSESQYQLAEAKIQEAKPVFAVIEPASIPLNPTYPNKKIIIIVFCLLSMIATMAWIFFGKDLYLDFKQILNNNEYN